MDKISDNTKFLMYNIILSERTLVYCKLHPELLDDPDNKKIYDVLFVGYMRQWARLNKKKKYSDADAADINSQFEEEAKKIPEVVEEYRDDAEWLLDMMKSHKILDVIKEIEDSKKD